MFEIVKKYGIVFCGIIAPFLMALPPEVRSDKAGMLTLDGLNAAVALWDWQWKNFRLDAKSTTPLPSYPVITEKYHEYQGTWKNFYYQIWIREKTSDTVTLQYLLRDPAGSKVRNLVWTVTLPHNRFMNRQITVDGRNYDLKPVTLKNVSSISFLNGERKITITGKNLNLEIFNGAGFNVRSYQLRIKFQPGSGNVREARLNLTVHFAPLHEDKLTLPNVSESNVPYKLQQKVSCNGINFDCGKAKKHLVLKKDEKCTVDLMGKRGKFLYMLHAADDEALPVLEVGAKHITLKKGIDFAGSKTLDRLPNGALISTAADREAGFRFSRFEIPAAAGKLSLQNSGKGKWRIAAVTLSDTDISAGQVESIFFQLPGEKWGTLEPFKRPVAGSILDFSFMQDAPAGKNGWIKINKNGHFYAEKAPERILRFYGVNLVQTALMLNKNEADALADEIAALGFNTVRIHHWERNLTHRGKSWLYPEGDDSCEFLPEVIDQFDYLFAAFKKRGIYMTLDLFCNRRLRAAEVKGWPRKPNEFRQARSFKSLLHIYTPAQENWKKFVRAFMTHRNPYTGLTYAEDPALFYVSLINEASAFNFCEEPLYIKAYGEWLKKQNLWSAENFARRDGLFMKFVSEVQCRFAQEASRYMRDGLKCKTLVTDPNWMNNYALAPAREKTDIVDVHQYWDHPFFKPGSGGMPLLHNQTSVLKHALWNPRTILPIRIFGKPFVVSEFNYVFPNRHRAEGGPVYGAYAALQDWGSAHIYTWHHYREGVRHELPIHGFNIAQDSLVQMAHRLAVLLFLRRDVNVAPSAVAQTFDLSMFDKKMKMVDMEPSLAFQNLGLFCRVGSLPAERKFPGVRTIRGDEDLTAQEKKFAASPVKVSETGEIIYDSRKGQFQVVSPKTEIMILEQGTLAGKRLQATVQEKEFQVIALTAMDGKEIKESSSLLLFHLSNVTNEMIQFSSAAGHQVNDWGINKQLIRKAKADVTLKLTPGKWKLQALDMGGVPKGEVALSADKNGIGCSLDTTRFNGTMVYHLKKMEK
ncbi:MAG: hypothetical protein IJW17_02845 [Lentisphaeria bacterium]|nr:hypothetical protein [Lentisphaeria bacterium]